MLASAADLHLVVAGQTPKVALEVAHAAIQFCEPTGTGRLCREAGSGWQLVTKCGERSHSFEGCRIHQACPLA